MNLLAPRPGANATPAATGARDRGSHRPRLYTGDLSHRDTKIFRDLPVERNIDKQSHIRAVNRRRTLLLIFRINLLDSALYRKATSRVSATGSEGENSPAMTGWT
jgi:hypothetical protein